jgi:hypothetical protein
MHHPRRQGRKPTSSFAFCVAVGSILPGMVLFQGCDKTTSSSAASNPCSADAGAATGDASYATDGGFGYFYEAGSQGAGSFDDGRCTCTSVTGGTFCTPTTSDGGGTSDAPSSDAPSSDAPVSDSTAPCEPTGVFNCTATSYTDPAGHRPYIGAVFPGTLTFAVTGSTMSVSGNAPFVGVSGACGGTLTGTGTVATYPNVTCEMYQIVVAAGGNSFTAVYEMGANGELPQAMSMIANISCTR